MIITQEETDNPLNVEASKWHRPIPQVDGVNQFTDEEWVGEALKLDLAEKVKAYRVYLAQEQINQE
jgi:hypothetical protein